MRHDHVGARSCLPKGRMTLKPALKPIALARKPLSEKTVAANVLRWGTGVINVDGCRTPTNDKLGGGAENPATDAVYKAGGWDRCWMHDEAAPSTRGWLKVQVSIYPAWMLQPIPWQPLGAKPRTVP